MKKKKETKKNSKIAFDSLRLLLSARSTDGFAGNCSVAFFVISGSGLGGGRLSSTVGSFSFNAGALSDDGTFLSFGLKNFASGDFERSRIFDSLF